LQFFQEIEILLTLVISDFNEKQLFWSNFWRKSSLCGQKSLSL